MGFILTCLVIIVFFTILAWISSNEGVRKSNAACTAVCLSTLSVVIIIGTFFVSYINYIDARKVCVNITNTYSKALVLYTAYANVPTGVKGTQLATDLTDQKYEDYQRYLHTHVNELKNKTVAYNKSAVGKKLMNSSWYWGWLISYPEEMKVISLPEPLL